MPDKIEFDLVDFANELGDAIDSGWVLSSKIPCIYVQLQEYLINTGQAVWNEELRGLDKI